MDGLVFIKQEPLLLDEVSQNSGRTEHSTSQPLKIEMPSIKTDPSSCSSSASLHPFLSRQLSCYSFQGENNGVTNTKGRYIFTKSIYKQSCQNTNAVTVSKMPCKVLNRYRPLSCIPRTAVRKLKKKCQQVDTNHSVFTNNSTQTVSAKSDDGLSTTEIPAKCFKPLSDKRTQLPFFQQSTNDKQRPMGSATIFSTHKAQTLPQQNSTQTTGIQRNTQQQIPVGSATIFSTNQQNLLQQNPLLSNQIQQIPNQFQTASATVLSANQQQNLFQQNSMLFRNSNTEKTNQQLQIGMNTLLSSNQQMQTSPFLSSNMITAPTGLPNSLQQISMPTVIQKPATGISGYILPTGSAFIPSSALVNPPANPHSGLIQLHSLPILGSMPVYQNIQTGIPIPHNTIPLVIQNNSDNLALPSLGLGIQRLFPVMSNSLVNVPSVSESSVKSISASDVQTQCAASHSSGIVLQENTNSNQNQNTSFPPALQDIHGNMAVTVQNINNQANNNQLVTLRQTAEDVTGKASNGQRIMILQGANLPVVPSSVNIVHNDQISKIEPNVPYIETLSSGQQIIRNLNPIDMTCISGLSVPLLPPLPPLDGQDTAANSFKNKNGRFVSSLCVPNESLGMLEQVASFPESRLCEEKSRFMGNTSKYSLLYSSQKEAQRDIHNNSDNLKQIKPNEMHCNSEVLEHSVSGQIESTVTILKPSSLKTSPNVMKLNFLNCPTEGLQGGNGGNMNIKTELHSCQAASDLQQEKRQTSKTSTMLTSNHDKKIMGKGFKKKNQTSGISETEDAHSSFRKRRKYENVFGLPCVSQKKPVIKKKPFFLISSCTCNQIKKSHVRCIPIQPKTDMVVDKNLNPNLALNKIKMVRRSDCHPKAKFKIKNRIPVPRPFSSTGVPERPILPKSLTTDLLKTSTKCDERNEHLKRKYCISCLESKDQPVLCESIVDDNVKCQTIVQTTEMSNKPMESSVEDDSVQIKIDSVFSLNEDCDACFLASKSPYHADSCSLLKEHKLSASFVVIEKETKMRFAALQKKVSQLRPKRTCSKQCRAHALQSMCHQCYFSPVLVHRGPDS